MGVKIEGALGYAQQKLFFPFSSPLDRFFHQFGIPSPNDSIPDLETRLDSGFFITGDWYIVTNNHVIENAKRVGVTADDGKTYQARVIGADRQTDVALIKVQAMVGFPYVRFASSEPHIWKIGSRSQ